jgi:hypothetical protein
MAHQRFKRGSPAVVTHHQRLDAASVLEAICRMTKSLDPAAERALAEAQARRAEREKQAATRPKEANGPKGPEPTRYGDWERNGIASDF